jgi:glycopeptide antibiotics resistance protein
VLRVAGWTAVIVLVVVPWGGAYQPHPHWTRVVWIPFSTPPPLTAWDVVVNLLLYVPFGYLFARVRPAWTWPVVSAAVLLSVATEFAQVYSHGRFPSITDVILNTAGAIAGLAVGRRSVRLTRS